MRPEASSCLVSYTRVASRLGRTFLGCFVCLTRLLSIDGDEVVFFQDQIVKYNEKQLSSVSLFVLQDT